MPPRTANPAFALRDILQHVATSGADTILHGWETTLHAPGGSLQFAQRHAEVVAMYSRVYDRLLALPDDADGRAQYMNLLPAWYEGIAYRGPWGHTGHPASAVCEPAVISQLTGLGYAFEMHSVTAKAPPDEAIANLRGSLDVWDKFLDGGEIDAKLANELRAHVDRLRMLLEDEVVKTFGTEPIIDASKNLFGAAVVAMGRLPGRVATKIGVALVAVAAFLHTAHGAVDDANGLLEGLVTMVSHVRELPSQLEEVGSHSKPALNPGNQQSSDDAPVDAEVVEDGPPKDADAGHNPQG